MLTIFLDNILHFCKGFPNGILDQEEWEDNLEEKDIKKMMLQWKLWRQKGGQGKTV